LAEGVGGRRCDQAPGVERADPARGFGEAQEVRLAFVGDVESVVIQRPGLLEVALA